MRTAIDASGRVVVPKAVRDALGLVGGTELDVRVVDGRVELEIAPTPMRLVETENGVVAVADRPMPVLDADTVRATLERARR